MRLVRAAALTLLLAVVIVTANAPSAPAIPLPRPASGRGVLIVSPFLPERADELAAIPLYRQPGVGRIATIAAGALPAITPPGENGAGAYAVAVLEKRGNWLKVVFDDAGRSAWLERARWWSYRSWEEFLPGREVRLLPGLKTSYYRLVALPADQCRESVPVDPHDSLRAGRVQDDWLQATLSPSVTGWLRWRDGDGRLLIAVPLRNSSQNY